MNAWKTVASFHICHVRTYLALCILIVCTYSRAQHPVFYQLNDEDGLPSNEVYQVLQDKDGFMWIGCEDGLFRYDGNSFKKYRNSSQNGVAVSDLRLDHKNRIWCRNFTGQLYRVEGDSLLTITDVSRTKMASNVFALQPDGFAWIVKDNHVVCFSDKGKIIHQIPLTQKGRNTSVAHMVWFDASVYISFINGVILQIDAENGHKTLLRNEDKTDQTTSTFYIKSQNLFLATQYTTLGKVDISMLKKGRFEKQFGFTQGKANARIFHYGVDTEQKVWLCTNEGLKPLSSSVSNIDKLASYFPGKKISYVLKDREGTYWVTTLQDGIFLIPSMEVKSYNTENTGIPEDNLTALCLTGANKVLVGSYTGLLSEIDLTSGSVHHFLSNASTVSTKSMVSLGEQTYVAHGPLTLIVQSSLKKQFPVYQIRDMSIRKGVLYYVNSNLSGFVSLMDLHKGTMNPYGSYQELGGRSVGVTTKGTVYYGLNSGLFIERKGIRREIRFDNKQIVATSISIDREKAYVATITHGLLLLENGKVLKRWDRNTSTVSQELRLVSIGQRFIWFCSNEVLYRMHKETGKIDQLGRSLGIQPKGINALKNDNGMVYLATDRGLIMFPEDLNATNLVKPMLRIRSIKVDNKLQKLTTSIVIPFDHQTISFQLDAPVLREKEIAHFRFRFAGSKHWSKQPVNRHNIDFNNLSPGVYTLELVSVNESGVWSDRVEYRFTVNSPFWQKWWFYFLLILFTALIVAVAFIGRIRFMRNKAELQHKALSAQLTALKAQMNPHFMYNALNSIQALIIQKDVVKSNLYLGKFSKLMRMILNASGKEMITLKEEVEILGLYLELEKLRFGNDFSYTISVDPNLDVEDQLLPSVIIQPFVENALKHGLLHKTGEKKLWISFDWKEELVCVVRDNGIGRKRSEEIRQRRMGSHQSFASEAVNRQVELMNSFSGKGIRIEIADLELDGESDGTEVKVFIPLS